MACNCGGNSTSSGSGGLQLKSPPDMSAGKAPDGTPIGQDRSQGGTVPAYGSPGGAGTAGPGGGYTAAGSQHATGLGATIPNANSSADPSVAALAKKYESSGDYGRVANNPSDPGGPSYGAYQIATNPGTMNNFINQLQTTDPAAYQALQNAGGAQAAKAGDPSFAQAWKDQAANNPQFAQDQDKFIQATHYDKAVASIQAKTGVDINSQPLGVQQAVFSWSVQSPGGAATGFTQAMQGRDINTMSPTDVTNAIYDQRSAQLRGTSALNNSIVANRFTAERQDALRANTTVPVVAVKPIVGNTQLGV